MRICSRAAARGRCTAAAAVCPTSNAIPISPNSCTAQARSTTRMVKGRPIREMVNTTARRPTAPAPSNPMSPVRRGGPAGSPPPPPPAVGRRPRSAARGPTIRVRRGARARATKGKAKGQTAFGEKRIECPQYLWRREAGAGPALPAVRGGALPVEDLRDDGAHPAVVPRGPWGWGATARRSARPRGRRRD